MEAMTTTEQENKRLAEIDLVDSLYESRSHALIAIQNLEAVVEILRDIANAIPADRIDPEAIDLGALRVVSATALGTSERDSDMPRGHILDFPARTIRRMVQNVNEANERIIYLLRGDFSE